MLPGFYMTELTAISFKLHLESLTWIFELDKSFLGLFPLRNERYSWVHKLISKLYKVLTFWSFKPFKSFDKQDNFNMSVQSDSVYCGYSCLKKASIAIGILGILISFVYCPTIFYFGLYGRYWSSLQFMVPFIFANMNILLVYGVLSKEPIILKIWLLLNTIIVITVSDHCLKDTNALKI